MAGSPALDKGAAATGPLGAVTTDQRDGVRPIDNGNITNAMGGNGSDIGAVEVGPVLSKAFDPTTISVGQTATLTFTITNSTGNPAQSGIAFTDTLPSGLTLAASPTTTCGGTVSGTTGGNTISTQLQFSTSRAALRAIHPGGPQRLGEVLFDE